jgi:YgiT-type zinc finger domain-containing protein
MKRCVHCESEALERSTTVDVHKTCGHVFEVSGVPVTRCTNCNEHYFNSEEALLPMELARASKLIELGVRTVEAFTECRKILGYGKVTQPDKPSITTFLGISSVELSALELVGGDFPLAHWEKIIPEIQAEFAKLSWKPVMKVCRVNDCQRG